MNSKSEINIYYCGKEACSPGHFFGPAIRPHYLMHFILSGKGIYETRGKKYVVSKGEAFLIRPQEITYYEADAKEPWKYAWVAFDGDKTEEMMKKAGFSEERPICNILRIEECGRYLKQLVDKFDKRDSNEYELTGLFYLIFSTAAGTYQNSLASGRHRGVPVPVREAHALGQRRALFRSPPLLGEGDLFSQWPGISRLCAPGHANQRD